MQCGGADGKGQEKKDIAPKAGDKESSEEDQLNSSDTHRGRQLPPGMKVKKRVSGEEATSPKLNSLENVAEKVQGSHTEQVEAGKITTGFTGKESKCVPSSSTQASRDSDTTKATSNKAESSDTRNLQDDDDDDVIVVSVKPAVQETSPVTAVQKTLTSFPGFQPASNIKVQQQNPKGLHNLLTSQLQQKKVSEGPLDDSTVGQFLHSLIRS